MNRYSPWSSILAGSTCGLTQSSMVSGWKWKTSRRTAASASEWMNRSTQRRPDASSRAARRAASSAGWLTVPSPARWKAIRLAASDIGAIVARCWAVRERRPCDNWAMTARILVGTCSWADKTLVDSGWYPAKAKTPEERLRFYPGQFPIGEVDATYYG